ncbi:MAG: sigma-E processing peptidase SpoIIGA [Oscillospiraceae bacterium]|nr:sigma-E processing peptidase SpoIIGA [Oscillospiraceae bacterium]
MQTIYVDVLIFINMFIDFFLLMCVKKFLNIAARTRRVVLGSLLGGVCSLVAIIPRLNPVVNILLAVATGALVVFATFGRCAAKAYIKRAAAFVFASIGFCGISILFYNLFKPSKMVISNGIVYYDVSPVLLILLTVICYIVMRAIQKITGRQDSKNQIAEVEVTENGIVCRFKSKIDTGCNLTEPFSGSPVIIADKSLFANRIQIPQQKKRVIPFGSLGGSGLLEGFKPDKVCINSIAAKEEIYIALSDNTFTGEVKSLMNGDITV